MNKNISVWRGSEAPPTNNHIWIKNGSIYLHDGSSWKVVADITSYENILKFAEHNEHFPKLDNAQHLPDGEFKVGEFLLYNLLQDVYITNANEYNREEPFIAKNGDILLNGTTQRLSYETTTKNPCISPLNKKCVNLVFHVGDFELGVNSNGLVRTVRRLLYPTWELIACDNNYYIKHILTGKYLFFNGTEYVLSDEKSTMRFYQRNSGYNSFELGRVTLQNTVNMFLGSYENASIREYTFGDVNNELYIIDPSLFQFPVLSKSDEEYVEYKIFFQSKSDFGITVNNSGTVYVTSSEKASYRLYGSYNKLYLSHLPNKYLYLTLEGNDLLFVASENKSYFSLAPCGHTSNIAFELVYNEDPSKALNAFRGIYENNRVSIWNRGDSGNILLFLQPTSNFGKIKRVISTQCATDTYDGLMSKSDKTKLDNLHLISTSGNYEHLANRPSVYHLGNFSSVSEAYNEAAKLEIYSDYNKNILTYTIKQASSANVMSSGVIYQNHFNAANLDHRICTQYMLFDGGSRTCYMRTFNCSLPSDTTPAWVELKIYSDYSVENNALYGHTTTNENSQLTKKVKLFDFPTLDIIALKADTNNRDYNTQPSDYLSKFKVSGIKTYGAIGLQLGLHGQYSSLLGIHPWNDLSGIPAHELAFTQNGLIMHRYGTNSWEKWKQLIEDTDISKVATSGDYNDLNNKPTKLSAFTNDTNFVTELSLTDGTTVVKLAEDLKTNDSKTVEDVFNKRTTSNNASIGNGLATLKSVGGNAIKVINSMGNIAAHTNAVIEKYDNFIVVYRSSFSKSIYGVRFVNNTYKGQNSHKYYSASLVYSDIDNNIKIFINDYSNSFTINNGWNIVSAIRSAENVKTSNDILQCTNVESEKLVVANHIFIDLTEMYGAGNEPTLDECDKLFGTMDALPQGISIATPTEFKSTGFNQFNPENVIEDKVVVNDIITSGDKKLAIIPCLPCKVGVGENNGYCIHGEFGDDIKVYLTPFNPLDTNGELYMHELAKDETTQTYIPQIKGYMVVEVPTTNNLCVHLKWSADRNEYDYEPYHESTVQLPQVPQMSEWGLAGITASGTAARDTIDLENKKYIKRIGRVNIGELGWKYSTNNEYGYNVFYSTELKGRIKNADSGKFGNILTLGYTIAPASALTSKVIPNKCIMLYISNGTLYIRDDAYTDAASFKAALNGQYLYYELAEPEVYNIKVSGNSYIANDYGVEQFNEIGIPVYTNIEYANRNITREVCNFHNSLLYHTQKNSMRDVAQYLADASNKTIKITYLDLVKLRNTYSLTPGQKYRIIDYVTTTSLGNTVSAAHQFDIIVEALTSNTLSEVASACLHDGDTYFSNAGAKLEAWKIWYSLDNDVNRFSWAIEIIENGLTNIPIICSEFIDIAGNVAYGDEVNTHNDYFIKYGYENDIEGNERLVIYKTNPDEYPDVVDYQDKFFFEGVGEIDGIEYNKWRKIDDSCGWDADEKLYIYTEIIVENNQIKDEYINNRCSGKGVIYRMVDEWNNDCPYDFKNIMFARANGELELKYYYTFSWVNEHSQVEDITLRQDLLDDGLMAYGTHSNIVKPYYSEISAKLTQLLNNILFINTWECEVGIFYGCYSNIFGNTCYNNTFGHACRNNTFGTGCYDNTFGDYCISNTFGDHCNNNTFGYSCEFNTLANSCLAIILLNNCYKNIFRDFCSYILLGSECHSNTFESDCTTIKFINSSDLSLRDSVQYVTVGKGCYRLDILSTGSGIIEGLNILALLENQSFEINEVNLNYETKVALNSKGELKIYCEADLIQ